MSFGKQECGRLVEYPAGIDAKSVLARCKIPPRVSAAPVFEPWLEMVEESAALVSDMARDTPTVTAGVQREWLEGLADAAHRMRNALAPLESGGERDSLTEILRGVGDYLLWRARDGIGARPRRPVVPRLRSDAPDVSTLLDRMAKDLVALQQICAHLQGAFDELPSSSPKHHERDLIAQCALSYRQLFGQLPPKRGWFGDEFMPYIGECVGMDIGHRIVGEVVSDLAAHPAAG